METMSRLIMGEHVESPRFASFVARENYLLQLVDDPGNGSLSRYEIAKLNTIGQRFDVSDDWEVAGAAIALPESQRAASSNLVEISVEQVLEAVGRGHEIAAILEDAAADGKAAAFFASPVDLNSSNDVLGSGTAAR